MYKLERACVKSRFPRSGAPIPLVDGFVHNNVLDLRNEVTFGKSPHPLLAHVTRPLVPEVTGIVGCNVHFLPTYPGMHQV